MHELHDDYPLAPEKIEISDNILSNYCSNIANEYGITINNLVQNLGNKREYVLLQLYLSLRMKLVKVHRILKLKQSDWLKKYIDF